MALVKRSELVTALATVAVSALSGPLGPVGVTAAKELVKLLQGAWAKGSKERELRDRVQVAITDWARGEGLDEEITERGLAWAVHYVQAAGCQYDLIAEVDFDPTRVAETVLKQIRQRDSYWGTEDEHAVAERAIRATYSVICPALRAEGGVILAAIHAVRQELRTSFDQLRNDLLGVADRQELIAYLEEQIPLWDLSPWLNGRKPSQLERTLEIKHEHTRMSAAEALEGVSLLTVLGGPGSGKTWLAQRLVREAAETALLQLRDPRVEPTSVEIPLFTTVARWAGRHSTGFEGLVEAALPGESKGRLRRLVLRPGTPVLAVADSLDEGVPTSTARTLLTSLTHPSGRRLVITSRPEAWHSAAPNLRNEKDTRVGTLTELRYPEDVNSYVSAWFDHEPSLAQHLIRQLEERQELRATAPSPLLLTFYCMLTEQQPGDKLPRRTRELYSRIIDLLFTGRWAKDPEQGIDLSACRATLQRWAWEGVKDAVTSFGLGAWPDTFTTEQEVNLPRALDHVAPKQQYPAEHTFTRDRVERRFLHRTLWEHLVAEHIATLTPKEAAEALLPHVWFDPDWQVTVPMAIATHPERSKLAKRLWRHHKDNPSPVQKVISTRLEELLLQAAGQTDPEDWTGESCDLIHDLRKHLAIRHPDLITASAQWTSSNAACVETIRNAITAITNPWGRGPLIEALVKLDPTNTEKAKARAHILDTLPTATDPWDLARLIEALAQLDPTEDQRAQARAHILDTLPTTNPRDRARLIEALVQLAPTEKERTHTRTLILDTLPTTNPWTLARLIEALAQLDPTEKERTQARAHILDTLPTATDPWTLARLIEALAQLDPTEDQRAQARAHILDTLPAASDPWDLDRLIEALAQLDPTDNQQTQTRAHILDTLPTATDPWDLDRLIEALAQLAPTEMERTQARAHILDTLPTTTDPWTLARLIEALAQLDPTEDQRTHTLTFILDTLPTTTDPWDHARLIKALVQLDPTEMERTHTRTFILDTLPTTTHPSIRHFLIEALVQLDPTEDQQTHTRTLILDTLHTTDLSSEQIHALLAFLRRITPVRAWLRALRSIDDADEPEQR
ncbi:NACHT domain-containing NTPase [Arachnia propionica]|uniref:NACHT domain-containing protein n=1 Tax=Arachnia propionica TaxID=1750 RepID=A0A3P1WYG4_9ACTN|nr:NACHT domain-containing protein [Arachnia propionica]RRD50450.1 NACHT domain-containing protein [Arachnia propionica]